jgi:hypothetical protein
VRSVGRAASLALIVALVHPPDLGSNSIGVAQFTDVTVQAGIRVEGLGNASAWVDYDVDGDLDLLATDSNVPAQRVYLYRNDGDGTFTDVTAGSGLNTGGIRSVAWGDHDNDGDSDLAATGYGFRGRTLLFRNIGGGVFTEVGRESGMVESSLPWRPTWADFDRDGWLDLFQANWGSDLLYRNDGDGTFTEVSGSAGVSHPGSSSAAAWADFDEDGWPDLFVADDGPDHLYRNDGDGSFTDVAAEAGVSDPFDSGSACWGDYDSDGRQDLYVVNIGGFDDQARNFLYRNRGDGTFADVTRRAGVGDVGDGRTCNWADFDNDGLLDLFATNHVHPNRLFRNRGGGRFTDVAPAAGIAQPADVFNGAWGDFDDDGDLDVMVAGHFGNVLFRNDGPTGGFLHLDLVGTASNRSAVGARAWTMLAGRRPNRTVEGSGGAYGQDSLTLEFGVGEEPGPFTLRVLWPSGSVQTLDGVPAGSSVTVVEP